MNEKIEEIRDEIQRMYVSTADRFIVEGLERKGFKFESKHDLIEFMKNNCNGEHYKEKETDKTTLFVKGIPFLEKDHNPLKIDSTLGFKFL